MNTTLAKADPRVTGLKALMTGDQFQQALKAALPRHLTPDKMVRVVLSAFQVNEKLPQCTPESILLSLMRAAMMGLEPDGGTIGHGYLVPYWSGKRRRYECQFIPGYRGLVQLARNSGDVADVWAEVVYERDEFSYELGLEPTLKHKRNDTTEDPGELAYAYAVARFRDGEKKFVVLPAREIEKVKASSSSKNRDGKLVGPWVDHEAEMWKKSAVRRLAKLLPLSPDREQRMAAEHASIDYAAAMNGQAFALPAPPPQESDGDDVDAQAYAQAFDDIAECGTEKDLAACEKSLLKSHPKLADAIKEMARDRREALKENPSEEEGTATKGGAA